MIMWDPIEIAWMLAIKAIGHATVEVMIMYKGMLSGMPEIEH
jgi:hypothetical protein